MKFKTLRGFKDLLPEEWYKYELIEKKLSPLVELFGYKRVETPALEMGELLTLKGGFSPEQAREIWMFKDRGGRWVGLRFDITTPLARIVASKHEVRKFPIRWYYFSRMWRYEEPQRGRKREFWQFGIELIGEKSFLADAEVLCLAAKCLRALGFDSKTCKILVSDRNFLFGMLKSLGVKDPLQIVRMIDKRGKLSDERIIKECNRLAGFDLSDFVSEILNSKPSSWEEISPYLEKNRKKNEQVEEAYENLNGIFKKLKIWVPELYDFFLVDLSIARGFDYYTGVIFEAYIFKKERRIGTAILGGGRYDELISLYGGEKTPATGWALGVERTIQAMEEYSKLKFETKILPFVYIIVDQKDDELAKEAFRISEMLRRNGISSSITISIYDSMKKLLKKELRKADKLGCRYAIIVDQKVKQGVVLLRDMKEFKQYEVKLDELLKKIKG